MSKDYAKKRRRPLGKSSFTPQRILFPSWAWLLLGALLGAGAAIALYWKTTSHRSLHPQNVTMTVKTPSGKTLSKTLAKASLSENGEKRFDFYNLLPNLAKENTVSEKFISPTESISYTIQAGSFRLLRQAEELKAKLAMNGIEASIQTHTLNQRETWYRVYVGPFQDKSQALNSQNKLEQANVLHSLLIKNRV